MARRALRRRRCPRLEVLERRDVPATYRVAGPVEWYRLAEEGASSQRLYADSGVDLLVPGDYDGDGRDDPAAYRPSTAQWFIGGAEGATSVVAMGPARSALPVPADYDGDGRTDLVVFRATDAQWIGNLSGGGTLNLQFGAPNLQHIPVPADYDGDGKTDVAVFQPSTCEWFFAFSAGGRMRTDFGAPEGRHTPIPADYDGDGKADMATYQPGTSEWFLRRSTAGPIKLQHGYPGQDTPIPADYDADGRADVATFHAATAEWFLLRSRDGGQALQFGWGGVDRPAPADYDGDGRVDPASAHGPTGEWFLDRSLAGRTIRVVDPATTPFPSSSSNWLQENAQYVDRAFQRGFDVAFYGDSLVRFWGDADREGVGQGVWNEAIAPLNAVNFGIASDVTQGLLWRLKTVGRPGLPRVVVLQIGTNNLGPDLGQSPEDTARGIAAVVRTIREISPETKILLMGIFPRGYRSGDPLRDKIRRTNAILSGLADGRAVRFLDIGDRLTQPDGSISPAILYDGLHLSAAGYRIWADAIRGPIEEMLA
jgi:lysophospholipase L1-like esterase